MAIFLSVFSALQSVSNSLFALSLLSPAPGQVPDSGQNQGGGPPAPARSTAPQAEVLDQAVWKTRGPPPPKGEHVTRSDKGGVNHEPILWGISPKTRSTYQAVKKDTKQ